jgi:hypothetical protein
MTIQEAIRSGKKFQRKSSPGWLIVDDDKRIRDEGTSLVALDASDIAADDWELFPERKWISAEDIRGAWERAYLKGGACPECGCVNEYMLTKELGL